MPALAGFQEGQYVPAGAERIWLPDLLDSFARFLTTNDIACGLRLVNNAAAAHFSNGCQYTTLRLSQPVPYTTFADKWGAPGAMRELTLKQRRRLLCLTAAAGCIPNLDLAAARAGTRLGPEVLNAASYAGQLEACRWLLGRGCRCVDSALHAAAQGGHQAVCAYLLGAGAAWHFSVVCAAARGGHPGVVEWLLQQRPGRSPGPAGDLAYLCGRVAASGGSHGHELLASAVEGYDLPALKVLHERVQEGASTAGAAAAVGPAGGLQLGPLWVGRMAEAAARSHTPDWQAKVEWVEALGYDTRSSSACWAAAACPDARARLEWLQRRGYPLCAGCLGASAGNVAAMRYLLGSGLRPHESHAARAAAAGQLDALVLLHDHGCPMDAARLLGLAAAGGHLPVVGWVVQQLGAEVGADCFLLGHAAASGNTELLAWLHQRGCPCGPYTAGQAAEGGCEAALEWLAARRCLAFDDGEPVRRAVRNEDYATLRCLRRLGWSGCLPEPRRRAPGAGSWL